MSRWHNRKVRNYDFQEKAIALEAFFSEAYKGMSLKEFSGICGINYHTLKDWMRAIGWDASRIEELRRGRGKHEENPLGLSEPVEALILQLKDRYPGWGPLKIKQYLFRQEQILLPTTRIYKFLKSRGLVEERAGAEQEPAAKPRSFEYPYPLAAVQMDVLDLTLSSGTTIYLMTLLDDFSRFVLGCRFTPVKTMEESMAALRESVRVYGVMEKLLTDLGSEFVSWQSFTAFEQLLCDWDVEHIQSGPRNPQHQGKVERWHQTVREALVERGPLDYSSEAQLWIRQVVDVYNYERPHQALGGLVPADRFFGLKEELEAELERYRSGERQGQRIYFACRVGDQKVVVSGPRADRLSVLVDGQRLGVEAGESAQDRQLEEETHSAGESTQLKPVTADASAAILPSLPVAQDWQLEEETHSTRESADDCG